MIIAHISDLHVSRFGVGLAQARSLAQEARQDDGWQSLGDEGGWMIQAQWARDHRFRLRDRLRLVDPDGTIHQEKKIQKAQTEQAVIDSMLALRARRVQMSAEELAARMPSSLQTEEMLAEDPLNTNLRFCALAHQLRREDPDLVLITGDITDDGDGYGLVEAGLAHFIDEGRLVCVAGNHDIYASPPLVTAPVHRRSEEEKRRLWASFATRVGMPAGGSHVIELGDGVALACLDSCHPPMVPGSASGMVMTHELHHVAGAFEAIGAPVRLACLHHHIVNPPRTALGGTPIQAGMRLRNANEVLELLRALNVEVIMNGHRHLGYQYRPALSPLFLSAPSSTMGCQSGLSPFYWRVEVGPEGLGRIVGVEVDSLKIDSSRLNMT